MYGFSFSEVRSRKGMVVSAGFALAEIFFGQRFSNKNILCVNTDEHPQFTTYHQCLPEVIIIGDPTLFAIDHKYFVEGGNAVSDRLLHLIPNPRIFPVSNARV